MRTIMPVMNVYAKYWLLTQSYSLKIVSFQQKRETTIVN